MRKARFFKDFWMSAVFAAVAAVGLAGLTGPVTAQEAEDCDCRPGVRTFIWDGDGGQLPFLSLEGRPMLGVSLDMGADLNDVGVRVTGLREDGPADRAGVREGDIIVAAGGWDLTQPLDGEDEMDMNRDTSLPGQRLVALIRELEEGEEIEIEVDRDGELLAFAVVPEELEGWGWPSRLSVRMRDMADRVRDQYRDIDWNVQWDGRTFDPPVTPDIFRGDGGDLTRVWLQARFHGLELVELNPGLGAYFGTEEGVLVADADGGSALGLRPGDVVVDVDGRRVRSAAQFRRILRSYEEDEEIALRIWRDGAETVIQGTIG